MNYVCLNSNNQFGEGETLEKAWEDFKNAYGSDADFDDLRFFEAEEIQVEQKIVKKTVVKKVELNPKAKP